MQKLSQLIDTLSAFLAANKGLLPIIGILLIIGNFVVVMVSGGFMAQSNLLLHIGLITAILGLMLGKAL